MDKPANLDVDAYLVSNGERGPLCEVRVWLPEDPDDDGRIDVTAYATLLDDVNTGIGFSLVSPDGYFQATELLIRSANSFVDRPIKKTRLQIEHIGTLSTHHFLSAAEQIDLQLVNEATFLLSQMRYALPKRYWKFDNDECKIPIHHGTPYRLPVRHSNGGIYEFELNRYWDWSTSKDYNSVIGKSSPVLVYRNASEKTPLTILRDCAKDATLLLSLASRWRVLLYGLVVSSNNSLYKEWQYPLSRARAKGIEEAEGRLIQPSYLERFIESTSERLCQFSKSERDAVALTIFALHPTESSSIESNLLSRLIALEMLAQNFGKRHGGINSKIKTLLSAYLPFVSLPLWPITGEEGGPPGLINLRHDLAHGWHLSSKVPDALSVASDHAQLWLEYLLLAILGTHASIHPESRLEGQVIRHGQQQVDILRNALQEVGLTGGRMLF